MLCKKTTAIRRLIILLLIVGCEEPNDEIKEVDWLLTQDTSNINEGSRNFNGTSLYWTDGNKPTIIDSVEVTECNYEVEDGEYGSVKIECGIFYTYLHQDDTIYNSISVNTIFHFVEPNYFETTFMSIIPDWGIQSQRFYPQEYEVFKYEYN